MGFPALVIVWNLETCEIVHKLQLHKGAVQDLSFSQSERFLASLGGRDDNQLVVWDVEGGQAICGAMSSSQTTTCVKFLNNSDYQLASAGKNGNIRIWDFDPHNRKLSPHSVQLGQQKRVFNCMLADEGDDNLYLGTETGDIFAVGIESCMLKGSGPKKNRFPQGITAMAQTRRVLAGHLIVGAGNGIIALMNAKLSESYASASSSAASPRSP
jgi:hypothetical protein